MAHTARPLVVVVMAVEVVEVMVQVVLVVVVEVMIVDMEMVVMVMVVEVMVMRLVERWWFLATDREDWGCYLSPIISPTASIPWMTTLWTWKRTLEKSRQDGE